MIRFQFSDQYQQYRYFVTMNNVGDLKQVIFELEYQGPKHPDALRSKVEFFMNENEWKNFKDIVNSVV